MSLRAQANCKRTIPFLLLSSLEINEQINKGEPPHSLKTQIMNKIAASSLCLNISYIVIWTLSGQASSETIWWTTKLIAWTEQVAQNYSYRKLHVHGFWRLETYHKLISPLLLTCLICHKRYFSIIELWLKIWYTAMKSQREQVDDHVGEVSYNA